MVLIVLLAGSSVSCSKENDPHINGFANLPSVISWDEGGYVEMFSYDENNNCILYETIDGAYKSSVVISYEMGKISRVEKTDTEGGNTYRQNDSYRYEEDLILRFTEGKAFPDSIYADSLGRIQEMVYGNSATRYEFIYDTQGNVVRRVSSSPYETTVYDFLYDENPGIFSFISLPQWALFVITGGYVHSVSNIIELREFSSGDSYIENYHYTYDNTSGLPRSYEFQTNDGEEHTVSIQYIKAK